jgi:uncharacterized protein (DUF2252 family)
MGSIHMRDPITILVEYNRRFVDDGRDPAWLRTKLDRLCASPFGFLRGTFHLFVSDWATLGEDALGPGDAQPIVGDLHLENFGAFKAQDGRYVFDVNDFDETASGTPAVDLVRLCTSIALADDKHGTLRAVGRMEACLDAYLAAARDLDLRAVDGKTKGLPAPVKDVLERAEASSRPEWIAERVEGEADHRRFKHSDKYSPVEDEARRRAVAAALADFTAHCSERPSECPSWPAMLDVAVRIAGTGSLGRWRYAVLMPGKGEKPGKELILEIKEALPSSLTPNDGADQAARVVTTERLLQGASPAYLGATLLGGHPYTVRELQPVEAKLSTAKLSGPDLDALCSACGTVLGRLHRRGGTGLPARLAERERPLYRRTIASALRYAEQVCEDHALLVARRAEAERALGLGTAERALAP